MRTDLGLAGALLSTGGVIVMVAAGLPQLYPVWTSRGLEALTLIGQHRGVWTLANTMFAIGAVLTLAGLGALVPVFDRPGSAAAVGGVTLVAVASTLWLANLAFRLAVTGPVAGTVAGGGPVPTWYEPVSAWTAALWSTAALTGALGTIGYGLALTGAGTLPGWTGWSAVVIGAVMLVLFLLTRDVPPFLLYVAPTIVGVTALCRA